MPTKEKLYSQLFRFRSGGSARRPGAAGCYDIAKALERVAGLDSSFFAGDWAVTNTDFIREAEARFREGAGWSVAASDRLPAECVAEIAYKRYLRGEAKTPNRYGPVT